MHTPGRYAGEKTRDGMEAAELHFEGIREDHQGFAVAVSGISSSQNVTG